METFRIVETKREQLFKLACVYKLPDQTSLRSFLLIRDNRSFWLENIYNQLTAMKIVFGALTGTTNRAAVATMVPPDRLQGWVMERNMQRILQEICNTGLLRLVGSGSEVTS